MKISLVVLTSFLLSGAGGAADWPQYKADASRSGYTAEPLGEELSLRWVHHPAHSPAPAWRSEMRMPFDHAHHVTIAGGLVFFGGSADGKVYALDADTGEERWSFFTEGPVRFPPTYWKERVYAPSDDGFLYCLNAADGALQWKKAGGPNPDRILGNDRMISRWPVRGAPVILDNILYFAAGVWPTDGIFIHALDPATGDSIWVNDDSGGIEMDQPHGGARAKSGVSAQGSLVADGDLLFLPTGRAVPAAFNRTDGAFRYFHLQSNRRLGGSNILAASGLLLNSGAVFDASGGALLGMLDHTAMAASPTDLVCSQGKQLAAFRLADLVTEEESADRKGEPASKQVLNRKPYWTMSVPHSGAVSLIIAGSEVISGTSSGTVSITDIAANAVVWAQDVEGVPLGLAAANGSLFVSTDDGAIHCFGGNRPDPVVHRKPRVDFPYGENGEYIKAAEEILSRTGIAEGYCLDLGSGDGRLAFELAKRSNLQIYGIEADAGKLALARERLDAAGLYGTRVTLLHGDPADHPFPDYFANLVVSGRSVEEGTAAIPAEAVETSQRPYGGIACIGKPGEMVLSERGALEGAGDWTHQYSNPANTICSDDQLVKGPLGMLWFRDADQSMPQRHGRGPAPLFHEGVLVVEGMDSLRGVDAYNGRTLWEFSLPGILKDYNQEHLVGAAATNSNFCVEGGSIYLRKDHECLRIDLHTGELISTFASPLPPDGRKSRTWGYIACQDGVLYGSLADERHVVKKAYRESYMNNLLSESYFFFALDAETGAVKWTFEPKDSIRHNAVAIGDGKVFLIDRPQAKGDLADSAAAARRRGKAAPEEAALANHHDPGVLYTLDAETGEVLWKDDRDVYGTLLAYSEPHDVLLMGYQFTRFKQGSEVGDRMSAYRAEEGTRMWERNIVMPMGYKSSSRPVINDRTVYLEPGAFDLLTGEDVGFSMERSYGCGMITSSESVMLFRSATLGYLDLESGEGTENFGGIRPGCWINAIPAGGLVLMPDATAGCTCSYLNRASIALQPYSIR